MGENEWLWNFYPAKEKETHWGSLWESDRTCELMGIYGWKAFWSRQTLFSCRCESPLQNRSWVNSFDFEHLWVNKVMRLNLDKRFIVTVVWLRGQKECKVRSCYVEQSGITYAANWDVHRTFHQLPAPTGTKNRDGCYKDTSEQLIDEFRIKPLPISSVLFMDRLL